ncbi:hypothetical protein CDV31_004320 [Fusarium ambrosium]|uniref:Uncharacterized protein n=1 Tax=Fusarium ambrosium TaxID=131363 RepID=A0A428URE3_9HYPO|nr:hypothetical protein CDV31_004320 [Fusarium ambrosium]
MTSRVPSTPIPPIHPPIHLSPLPIPGCWTCKFKAWDIRPIPSDHFQGYSLDCRTPGCNPSPGPRCLAYHAPVLTLVLVL